MTRDGIVVDGALGRIVITPLALSGLVRQAAESVAGVRVRRPKRAVEIEADAGLRVAVAIEAGTDGPLPATGQSVQSAVASALEVTTGHRPVVDVTIEAVHP